MRFQLRFLESVTIAVCAAGVLGSCAVPAKSGISGHVTVDAGCPETIDSTACAEFPLPARISLKDASGATVGETTSNDQGEFQLDLAAGTYELHASNLTGLTSPAAAPEQVVVATGFFTEVKVSFDSGVR